MEVDIAMVFLDWLRADAGISFTKFATRRGASSLMLDFVDLATRFGLLGRPSSEGDLEGGGVGRAVDRWLRLFCRRQDDGLVCGPYGRSGRESQNKRYSTHLSIFRNVSIELVNTLPETVAGSPITSDYLQS